jgi:hypothetical protein
MSPAYHVHPEFGYLCPSRRFRRVLRAVLALTAFGTLAGAFALGGGHDAGEDRAPLIAAIDVAASDVAAMPAAEPTLASATAARSRPPERGKAACEGEAWTYLDGKCVASGARRPQTAAATDHLPIATIPLGRSAPPPPEPAPAEAATAAPPPEPERAAEPAAAASAAAAPAEQSAAVPQERRKTSRGRRSSRAWAKVDGSSRVGRSRDDRRNARVSAAPGARDRQVSMPKSAMGWAKQLRGCAETARCPVGEQLMRALLSSGM